MMRKIAKVLVILWMLLLLSWLLAGLIHTTPDAGLVIRSCPEEESPPVTPPSGYPLKQHQVSVTTLDNDPCQDQVIFCDYHNLEAIWFKDEPKYEWPTKKNPRGEVIWRFFKHAYYDSDTQRREICVLRFHC